MHRGDLLVELQDSDFQAPLLRAGTKLVRMHGSGFPANSFNPNIGRDMRKATDGARFNPFPDAGSRNVATLYAADHFSAAALESVFHAVDHRPSATFPRSQLNAWYWTELEVLQDLTIFELINPNLRQLRVRGRKNSFTESELIHSQASEYPSTRTWAQYLHVKSTSQLHGLGWRPRLGGQGTAYVFFGDRSSAAIAIRSSPQPLNSGPGLAEIEKVAAAASINIVDV